MRRTRREPPWWATVLILVLKIVLVLLLGGVPVFFGKQAVDTAYDRGLRNGMLRRLRNRVLQLPQSSDRETPFEQWNANLWGVPPMDISAPDEPEPLRRIRRAGCHGAQ